MEHVMSRIMGCASTDEVGKVREGQDVEFLASLVIVQEVVDHMAVEACNGPAVQVWRVVELFPWGGCADD